MKVYQLNPLTGEILHMKEFLRLIIISIPFIKKKNTINMALISRKGSTRNSNQTHNHLARWAQSLDFGKGKKKKKFLFVQLAKRSDTKLEAEAANQMR